MMATVIERLNQKSLGRRVSRFGSSTVPFIVAVSVPSPRVATCSMSAVPRPPTLGEPLVLRAAGDLGVPPERCSVEPVPQRSGSSRCRRLRSETPMAQAKAKTATRPAPSAGSIGTKTSEASTCSAAAARAVGPPHGTMFSVPLVRPATQVSTTGLMPRRW